MATKAGFFEVALIKTVPWLDPLYGMFVRYTSTMMPDFSKDPRKSAIYNPKEFRGSPPSTQIARSRLWSEGIFVFLPACILGASLVSACVYGLKWMQTPYVPSAVFTPSAPTAPSVLYAPPIPPSGVLQKFYSSALSAPAPLRISAKGASTHFFIKLEDWQTAAPVLTIFLRRGEEVALHVPLGQYRLKFAVGDLWLGPEALFGPRTSASQASRPLAFQSENQRYQGHIVDLAQRSYGNLHTTPVAVGTF